MIFEEANEILKRHDIVSIMDDTERQVIFALARGLADMMCEAALDLERPVGARCTIVEVGTAYGGTAILMALAGARVDTIDNGQSGQVEVSKHNVAVAGVGHLVRLIVAPNEEVVVGVPDISLPMVLVDGEHEGESPGRDLAAWAPKVVVGGWLLVDDVANAHPAVTLGVLRFLTSPVGRCFVFRRAVEIPGNHRHIKLVVFERVC